MPKTKLTPKVIDAILKDIAEDALITVACADAGIDNTTWYAHLTNNPDTKRRYEEAKERRLSKVRHWHYKKMMGEKPEDTDTAATQKWMERRDPDFKPSLDVSIRDDAKLEQLKEKIRLKRDANGPARRTD